MLGEFVSNAPDALVFTDANGRIQLANPAFDSMTQLGGGEQARGEYGAMSEVEVSAAAPTQDGKPMLAFAVRDVGRRLGPETRRLDELPRSTDEPIDRVGRVPLKDIVGETTDLIERHCIETALKRTSNNRASAAQMLGLSRQSLYVKLRRYGFAMLSGTES